MGRGRVVTLVGVMLGALGACSGEDVAERPTGPSTSSAAVDETASTSTVSSSDQVAVSSSVSRSTAPTTSEPASSPPVFEPSPCPVEPQPELDVECGVVRVSLHRADPEAGEVSLAVARVRSSSPEGALDPIVWLSGGPGRAALEQLARPADEGGVGTNPLLAGHDLVFVDQRGSGASTPVLDCPGYSEAYLTVLGAARPFSEELSAIDDFRRSCRDELLAQGVDLTAYDTIAIASDFDDVRRALGIERWGLLATSYGTVVAQELMRSHPDGVSAAVLDSVVPVDKTQLDRLMGGYDRAIEALLTSCEMSDECDARYPELRSRFAALIADFQLNPMGISIAGDDGERRLLITGADLYSGIAAGIGSTELVANIPLFIELAEQRSPVVAEAFGNISAGLSSLPEAMTDAVNCRDRFSAITRADLIALVEQRPELSLLGLEGSWASCETWDAGSVPGSFHRLVDSSIPALVLAGSHDSETPPSDGALVADHLEHATFVELEATGHVVFRSSQCADELVTSFFAAPTGPLDLTCADQMPPIDFAT
jgi:pimeloyl-ACP methyl ester carboxylesterase